MEETHENNIRNPTSSSLLPSWKLYDNPFYFHSQHQLRFPTLSSSLCHLTFFPPASMQSELDLARAEIEELKVQIKIECRMRKKAESMNKRLAKVVMEERKKCEAVARLCEELEEEVVSKKVMIDRMKKDMEEERKMMRIADVWREERVQMKLKEARILMEKKIFGILEEKEVIEHETFKDKRGEDTLGIADLVYGNSSWNSSNENKVRSTSQRRGSPDAENPHIRRGIKGFVEEFPKVIRAVGSRGRQSGSNLECQRAARASFETQEPGRSGSCWTGQSKPCKMMGIRWLAN